MRRPFLNGPRSVLAGLLVVAMAGCKDEYISETTIDPDGQVSRAVYQSEEATPGEARDPKRWEQTTYASSSQVENRRAGPPSVIEFPARPKDENHRYFVAWGRFRSVADIPDHLVMKPPENVDLPAGRLRRDYVRNDYGFLVEHRWKETLTDCVSFDDMRQARAELVDLLADVGGAIFDETLGREYDSSGLVAWLKSEGKEWLAEVTDTLFVSAAGKGRRTDEEVWEEVAKICGRRGLVLGQAGTLFTEESLTPEAERFVTGLARKHVRRRDGRPLGREDVDVLREAFFPARPGAKREALEASALRVIERKFGGEDAFKRRLDRLVTRVGGVYFRLISLGGPGRFTSTLTVPGEVFETNGRILATNRVRWQFDATEAYPFGFTMECRSFAADTEAQLLLPERSLADRESMLRFVDIVKGQERLAEALRECRDRKSMKPLVDCRLILYVDPKGKEEIVKLFDLYRMFGIRPE